MIRGSIGVMDGHPIGLHVRAGLRMTVFAGLAAACLLAASSSAFGQLPSECLRQAGCDISFELSAKATSGDPSRSGAIEPGAARGSLLFDDSETRLAEYLSGGPPPAVAPEPTPADDTSSWLLPEAESGSDVQYVLGRHGRRALPVLARPGPIRRWLHGLFGLGCAAIDPELGGVPPWLRENWRFRPYTVGWFMGAVSGGPLLDDWVTQESGYFGGYRIGWDYTRYWGCEMRLGFGYLELADSQRAIEAQEASDATTGLPPDDPFYDRFDERRDSDLVLWDVSLLYYPWGNTTWRPYLLIGLGAARVDFIDRLSVRRAETVFEVPLGAGMKIRWCDWLALRFDVTDNIVCGDRFDTVHDLSYTGGVEILFGGTRKAYWPWNPGRHYW